MIHDLSNLNSFSHAWHFFFFLDAHEIVTSLFNLKTIRKKNLKQVAQNYQFNKSIVSLATGATTGIQWNTFM